MINGFFKHGARHMVEVQLHHNSMLFVRGNLGGHYIYARFRALMEAADTAKAKWAKAKWATDTTTSSGSDSPEPQSPANIDIDSNRDENNSHEDDNTPVATPQPPLERTDTSPTPTSTPSSDPFLALVELVRENLRLPPMSPLDVLAAGADEVGMQSRTDNLTEMANALAEELGLDLRC